MLRPFLVLLALALLSLAQAKTNVIVFLADDLGYSDLGCYGSEIKTPNLDALAADGLRLTNFYNTARCWPSRAALLTGYYAQATRRDAMPGVFGGGQGVRPSWAQLLPLRLREQGYRSYHSGKWHIDGLPMQNGFDHSYDVADYNRYFNPQQLTKDDQTIPPIAKNSGYYATDAIADHAIECLKEHAASYADRPFFAYVAFNAPHFPLQALPADIEKYQGVYQAGWDVLRQARYDRQVKMGLVTSPLSPIERDLGPPYAFPQDIAKLGPDEVNRPLPWAQLSAKQQAFQASKMAVHAAMVDRMDQAIGRILAQVKAMKAWDDTLILFLSDNGASAEMMVRGDGHDQALPAGSAGTFLSIGPGWSSLCNTPHRRHKTWVHEGGISTSLIAHWPKGIAAQGQLVNTPGHLVDVVPTILELAHAAPLATEAKEPAAHGLSLLSLLTQQKEPARQSFWWLHEGNSALRVGDWKIVKAKEDPWALYNLSADRGEQKDLATAEPERLTAMIKEWNRQAALYLQEASADGKNLPGVGKKKKK